jgi:hypothetical protein
VQANGRRILLIFFAFSLRLGVSARESDFASDKQISRKAAKNAKIRKAFFLRSAKIVNHDQYFFAISFVPATLR